jgi:hypothetical protein
MRSRSESAEILSLLKKQNRENAGAAHLERGWKNQHDTLPLPLKHSTRLLDVKGTIDAEVLAGKITEARACWLLKKGESLSHRQLGGKEGPELESSGRERMMGRGMLVCARAIRSMAWLRATGGAARH